MRHHALVHHHMGYWHARCNADLVVTQGRPNGPPELPCQRCEELLAIDARRAAELARADDLRVGPPR